jgi:Flp pilus assembly protein TadG
VRRPRSLRTFAADRGGGVIVWLALATPALAALCALSVDVARIYNLDAELQTAADALARAGAVELDGGSDAMTRAQAALNDLVENDRRFANGPHAEVRIQTVRYLSSLPVSDTDPITAAYVTTNPKLARYLEVAVEPETVTTLFPPELSAGLVSVSLGAKAVGGRMKQMCGAAPVFICNPVEDDATLTLDQALNSSTFKGRQLLLRSKSGSSTYAPGQFGYLETPAGQSAKEMKDFIAEVNPKTCYAASGATLRTGTVSSVSQGFNTRFGDYQGNFKRTETVYPAASNTRAYPRDPCFATGACTRLGDGGWNVVEHMRTVHRSPASAEIGGVMRYFNYANGTVTPSRPTRYEVYRWEIAQAGGTPPDADSDRRVMPVTVLNCQAENLSASSVPVAAFAKVFLTEPMATGQDDVIWGELIGALKWGVDSQARDQVDVRR